MPPSAPAIRLTVEYDDDVSAAAEALLAVLRRPADPESEPENGASEDEAA